MTPEAPSGWKSILLQDTQFTENKKEAKMSKRDQKRFVRRLLVRTVRIAGINGKVTVADMFTRGNNAVVVIRRKDGDLTAVGL